MNPLLYLGHERALEQSDLFPLAKNDETKTVATLFDDSWQRQLKSDEYVSFLFVPLSLYASVDEAEDRENCSLEFYRSNVS